MGRIFEKENIQCLHALQECQAFNRIAREIVIAIRVGGGTKI